MEELFNTQLPDGDQPDIQLCIFPHLKEFMVIDLRIDPPSIKLLNTDQVLTGEFYRAVESEMSEVLRESTEHPFAHLIGLPIRLEETIRETAMSFILEHLGVAIDADEDAYPSVIVFVVSGGALAAQSDVVLDGLKRLLREHCGDQAATEWGDVLLRLITQESDLAKMRNRNELTEALSGDSPDFFTLWENRN